MGSSVACSAGLRGLGDLIMPPHHTLINQSCMSDLHLEYNLVYVLVANWPENQGDLIISLHYAPINQWTVGTKKYGSKAMPEKFKLSMTYKIVVKRLYRMIIASFIFHDTLKHYSA